MQIQSLLRTIAGGLLVSCQAPDNDPFRDSVSMARFAQAAERGGAIGLRVNGSSDVEAVRCTTKLPILGIQKRMQSDGKVLITPSFEDARQLVNAGAQVIAVECTRRAQSSGALELIRRIRAELHVPVMADIATLAEALAAEEAGAELVASTMRGYTVETELIHDFEPAFIAELSTRLKIPVLAEGRVHTPQQAVEALGAGAFAVIVGTAITRPEAITARFAAALSSAKTALENSRENGSAVIGIDLGGTNTKAAILTSRGVLERQSVVPTPTKGRKALLHHLAEITMLKMKDARQDGVRIEAVGIATAGWVDPEDGTIVYATENLPEWTDTRVSDELQRMLNLRVTVENDANALAIAERHFGAGRGVDHFVCITLGTGVGGACYSGGRLLRGAHHFGNAIGHLVIQPNGEACSCGLRGCLETYTNAAALVRFADGDYPSAEAVIRAAHSGVDKARRAVRQYAEHLSLGIASIVHLLDPELLILAGGIAQENPLLFDDLNDLLLDRVMAAKARRLRLVPSPLGYYGAVYGAGAIAREKIGPPGWW